MIIIFLFLIIVKYINPPIIQKISFINYDFYQKVFNREGCEYKDKMYAIQSPEIGMSDLLVTGRHSILLDDYSTHTNRKSRNQELKPVIDGKVTLVARYLFNASKTTLFNILSFSSK